MTTESRPTRSRPVSEDVTWFDELRPTVHVDDEFANLTHAMSELQEAFTRSHPTADQATELAARIRDIAGELATTEVDEDGQISGKLWGRPGRGQIMAPTLHIDEVTSTHARGHVTIDRFHAGRSALNGGVTPMIFDEMLSRLGNSGGRAWARTANLSVDYRRPAPLHRRLTVTADFVGQDGRKRYLRGAITDGDTVIAEATGLWVVTAP